MLPASVPVYVPAPASATVYICTVCRQYKRMPEEGSRSLGLGAQTVMSCHVDALNQTLAVSKSGRVLNQQAISPALGSNLTTERKWEVAGVKERHGESTRWPREKFVCESTACWRSLPISVV